MSDRSTVEKCLTYIDCHLHAPQVVAVPPPAGARPCAVTISREAGAGGILIAEKLATELQRTLPRGTCPWTVFHKNLVDKVLTDHSLPERLAQFMPEDKTSYIADALEELLGLHPSAFSLVRQTTETILQLAELGNVILVGRAANVITAKMTHVVHIRLVGSIEPRCARVQAYYKLSRSAALAYIRKEDAGRRRYVRKYFDQAVENPLLYHLVINTDDVSETQAAGLIAQLARQKANG